jgi:Tfp pilus assembly protein PilN
MSRKTEDVIVVGGVARADLLPPSVREAIRRRPIVRRLIAFVLVVAVATVAAVAGATYLALTAQAQLVAEQERSESLLAQQLLYADARAVANAVAETTAARAASTATEADWNALLAEIRATLPEGVLLTSIAGEIRAADTGEAVPLRQNSVGSFTINAISDTVPNVEAWIARLEGITGYAGIAPPVSVTGGDGAVYTVRIEVLLDEGAFLLRFAAAEAAHDDDATNNEDEEG